MKKLGRWRDPSYFADFDKLLIIPSCHNDIAIFCFEALDQKNREGEKSKELYSIKHFIIACIL